MDYHVHLVGHGDGGSGCSIHESVRREGEGLKQSDIYMRGNV